MKKERTTKLTRHIAPLNATRYDALSWVLAEFSLDTSTPEMAAEHPAMPHPTSPSPTRKGNIGLTRRAEKTSEAHEKEKSLSEHQPEGGASYDFPRAQTPFFVRVGSLKPHIAAGLEVAPPAPPVCIVKGVG